LARLTLGQSANPIWSEKVKVYFILICASRVCVCVLLTCFALARKKVFNEKKNLQLAKGLCTCEYPWKMKTIKAHETRTNFQGIALVSAATVNVNSFKIA